MPTVLDDPGVRDAIVAIDAWDEPNFRIAHGCLALKYPEQDAFLFAGGLAPATGIAALLTVKTFLDRLDALLKGTKADKAAAALLAERGITVAERARMRKLLAATESAKNVGGEPEPELATSEARTSDLLPLYVWYADWTTVARAIIRRRDHLIRLGLASRKRRAAATPEPTPAPSPVVNGQSPNQAPASGA